MDRSLIQTALRQYGSRSKARGALLADLAEELRRGEEQIEAGFDKGIIHEGEYERQKILIKAWYEEDVALVEEMLG